MYSVHARVNRCVAVVKYKNIIFRVHAVFTARIIRVVLGEHRRVPSSYGGGAREAYFMITIILNVGMRFVRADVTATGLLFTCAHVRPVCVCTI